MRKLTYFLFFLLIFLLGFMQPSAHILGQRIPAVDFIFSAAFLVWGIALWRGDLKFYLGGFYLPLAFYFLAMAVSVVFSVNPQSSFIKLLGEAYLLMLAVMAYNLIRDANSLKRLTQVWLASAAIVVAIGVATIFLFYFERENWLLEYTLYMYGAVPVGNYPRIASTMNSANALCNYLTISLLMLFLAERLGWIKAAVFYCLYFCLVLVAFFTLSSTLGGVALVLGVWLWLMLKNKNCLIAYACFIFGLVVASGFLVLNLIAMQPHESAAYSFNLPFTEQILSPSPRLMVWEDALKTFSENFWTGRGLGQNAAQVVFRNTDGHNSILLDAHNTVLSVAAQTGVFGLAAMLWLMFYLGRRSFPLRLTSQPLATIRTCLGLAFLGAFIFQGISGSFEDSRHIWVMFGLLASVSDNSFALARNTDAAPANSNA